jgi:hypothetical protein
MLDKGARYSSPRVRKVAQMWCVDYGYYRVLDYGIVVLVHTCGRNLNYTSKNPRLFAVLM